MTPRTVLLECFRAALDAVDARRRVRRSLESKPVAGSWHVVAVGKAAGAMTLGAIDAIGARVVGGLVVVPPGHLPGDLQPDEQGLVVHVSSHPVPDERSVAAGQGVAEYVASLPDDARVLYLVSGGASALLECPRPRVTLEDLRCVNEWALASGASITRINAVRARLSSLKGGGLAQLTRDRKALALMISDVPGDDPRVIGSGLLHAPDGRVVIDEHGLPAGVLDALKRAGPLTQPDRAPIPVRMVATQRLACLAAAARASTFGWQAKIVRTRLSGDAVECGRHVARSVARLPDRTVSVRSGESTVVLPEHPGRGGRNQHFALAAAIEFEALGAARARLLAAGTDGVDGATTDAGALIDARTCVRGRDSGLDPHVSLARADSGSFLEASGDLLHTGATYTNVGDLVLALNSDGDE
jgi:glycerate 2-kinase